MSEHNRIKRTVCCAICIALAFVTSFIKLFQLPFGGSVTLFSMLFITLTGYLFGLRAGLMSASVYSILQLVTGSGLLSLWQALLDYVFAYVSLGLSGLLRKHLIPGYLLAIFCRAAFSSLAGYLFYMEYMPDNFPKQISFLYPVVYNYGFIFAEGIMTVILLCIPPVRKQIAKIRLSCDKN